MALKSKKKLLLEIIFEWCSFVCLSMKLPMIIFAGLITGELSALGGDQVFQGSFTEQITNTGDTNLYYVGQIFTGYYQYSALSPDGAFATDTSGYLDGSGWTNYTLDGMIFLPFSRETSWIIGGNTIHSDYGPGGKQNGLLQTGNGGVLTVQTGHVTEFSWSYENAGFYFQMNVGANGTGAFQALSFYDTLGSLTTSGTFQLGDPVPAPEPRVTAFWLAGMVAAVALRWLTVVSRHA
jgi:hypothetical protein